jgi:Uma2 family endonuclease
MLTRDISDHPLERPRVPSHEVSWEAYMERYAAHFMEFVDGRVVPLSPVHVRHDELYGYLRMLLSMFFAYRPIGRVVGEPFVMKLSDKVSREPDLQIILEASYERFRPTYMDGPADIVIEIISPESMGRDHGTKYQEYEAHGVPEFWIIDPLHAECRFYRLVGERYALTPEGADGYYATPQLPDFRLHVPTLWRPTLPNGLEIVESVKAMIGLTDGGAVP